MSTFFSKTSIIQSKIIANTSQVGAGIEFGFGELTIIQCLISGNNASIQAGGMNLANANTSIFQSTISGNKADNNGGGIRLSSGELNIANSIIALNDDNLDNIAISRLGIMNDLGGNLIDIAPLFRENVPPAPSDGGDLRLQSNSPAINKGVSANLPKDDFDLDNDSNLLELLPVDLQNNPRIKDGQVDAGAFEYSMNTSIPTFNEWTLLIYALLMLNMGVYFLKKKFLFD